MPSLSAWAEEAHGEEAPPAKRPREDGDGER